MKTIIINVPLTETRIMSANKVNGTGAGSIALVTTNAGSRVITGALGDTLFINDLTREGVITKPFICHIDPAGQLADSFVGMIESVQSETEATLVAAAPSSITEKQYQIIYDRPTKVIVKVADGGKAEIFDPTTGISQSINHDTIFLSPPPCLVTAQTGDVEIELQYS